MEIDMYTIHTVTLVVGVIGVLTIGILLAIVDYKNYTENIQCRDYNATFGGTDQGFAKCITITTNADGSINITEKLYPYKQIFGG